MNDEGRLHSAPATIATNRSEDTTGGGGELVNLGDIRARVIRMREVVEDWRRYEDGSLPAAGVAELQTALEKVESDLHIETDRGVCCPDCGHGAAWPGLLWQHVCPAAERWAA